MKRNWLITITLISIISCTGDERNPDVSSIKIDLTIQRFDKDFFAIDTLDLNKSLAALQQKYPTLLPIFIKNIIGVEVESNPKGINNYIKMNGPVYDSVEKEFKTMDKVKDLLETSFRYVKYYFPDYRIPKVYTIVGPIDLLAKMNNGDFTPNFLGTDFLSLSLQFYLGTDCSIYSTEFFINNVAPLYRSRRFERKYIAPDAMKLIVDDLFPDKSTGKPLIDQMIEKGKQWWLLDRFMPDTPDSLKTGYTQKQLDWCKENEGLIWNFIKQNENPYSIEPVVVQTYLGESPYTQGMPESSPGNIGQWIGLQIVKKFARNNKVLHPAEIMKTDPKKILEDAKYKPK
jgi:hypothetical protein